jgi:hypothetical protein
VALMVTFLFVKRAVRVLPLIAGATLLIYVIQQLGPRQIAAMLMSLRWTFVPVFALYGCHQISRAAALMVCVPQRYALRFRDALWIRLSGEAVEFLTFTGPLLSEPAKGWLLQQRGCDRTVGLASTLTEYFTSTVVASITAVLGVGYVLAAIRPAGPAHGIALGVVVGMSIFAALAISAVAARIPLLGPLVRFITRKPTPGLDVIEETLMQTAHDAPGRLATIVALEVAAQLCLGFELALLLGALNLPCTVARAILMEGTMKFMNAGAFFIPAQVGVAEGSYALIFRLFGLSAAAGAAIAFVRHVRSLLTALVGVVALATLRFRSRARRRGSAIVTAAS